MKSIKESVKVWRPWQFEQVELCQGVAVSTPARQFLAQEYMIVSVQSGAMDFRYRNTRTRGQAVDGTLYVIEPGEVWSCHSEELSFSHILIDPTLLQQTATELFQREQSLPHFPRHALFDPSLNTVLLHLAASSLAPVSRLQQDETLLRLLAQFLLSHAEKGGALPRIGREHAATRRTKEYLEAHYAEEVTLQELANMTNMSPFHLIRVFRQDVGLPPHAYQIQLRLARARTLLAQGFTASYVAMETGFFDQPHLTRQFKRYFLVTPGSYSTTAKFS
jgi:AraC-like DNA-binding protein